MEIKEKYLPIGTVVLLKDGSKKAMIIGFCPVTKNGESFDYSACMFPEGVLNNEKSILFNHENIEMVFFEGYQDEEEQKFARILKEAAEKAKQETAEKSDSEFIEMN